MEKYGFISEKAFDSNNIWSEFNNQDLWASSSDLLQELGAEVSGEPFICCDGWMRMIPVRFYDQDEEACGYLAELLEIRENLR